MGSIYPPRIEFWREPGFTDLTNEQKLQRWRQARPNLGKDTAGAEIYRGKLWGSETVRSLGCTLLPTLKETDIYATGEQLEQLEREVKMLQDEIVFVAGQTEIEASLITHYLQNITEAIERAKGIGGGVVIW